VRCIAVTGSGDAFSAGADIADMAEQQRTGNAEEIRHRVAIGGCIVRRIRSMPKPVIAVMNGVAAGAAMNLALACDFRLGCPRAGYASSFVRLGLIPDWGGLHLLTERVGAGRAAELMMTGRRVDADEALAIGLLDHVYPTDGFTEEVDRFLAHLVAGPPQALASIKQGIRLGLDHGLEAVLAFDPEEQKRLFLGDECREGIAAFREKRRPNWG
jgi:2-(1,2-epoxy-1,2-dihydrophenyl)acetyl-CoA isomerase